MSNRRIFIAGFLFALSVILLVLDQRMEKAADKRRTLAERLVPFDADKIASIEIDRLNGKVKLDRKGEEWRLTEPIDTPADPQAMNEILHYFDQAQRIGALPASPEQWAEFGLEKPSLRVKVTSAEKTDVAFNIGVDAPVYGEAYAALNGEKDYFTVSGELKKNLSRKVDALRDRSLLPFNANEATTVTLFVKAETPIQMVKEDATWRLLEPIRDKADQSAVEEVVHTVQLTKAADFIDTDTLQLQKYGLDVPTVVAQFESSGPGGTRNATLTLGRQIDEQGKSYYAKRSDLPSIFVVPDTLAYALIPKITELRAKDLFTIPGEKIRKLEIDFANDAIHLKRDSSNMWRFDEPDNEQLADQAMANDALRYLLTMKIRKFLAIPLEPDFAGLAQPRLRVVIEDDAGKSESVETGRSGQTTETKDIVYARRSSGGEIFGVPLELPGKLFLTREKFMSKSIYSFDPSKVGSLKYTTVRDGVEHATLFTRQESSWLATAVRTGEQAQVSRNVVESLLLHISALQWSNKLDPGIDSDLVLIKSSQLEDPPIRIEIFDTDQKPVAYLGLGPQLDRRFFYVRTGSGSGDQKSYYAITRDAFLPFVAALREVLQP